MLDFNIDLTGKTILVTGAAGFIGSNLSLRLLQTVSGVTVVGLDSMNDYYDVSLKEDRLKKLSTFSAFKFIKGNLADKDLINSLFATYQPQVVVNLAAQAGVRYSITNPDSYIESNLIGFYHILEACRNNACVAHLVYASSSSVYGVNKKVAFSGNLFILLWRNIKSKESLRYPYPSNPSSVDGQ